MSGKSRPYILNGLGELELDLVAGPIGVNQQERDAPNPYLQLIDLLCHERPEMPIREGPCIHFGVERAVDVPERRENRHEFPIAPILGVREHFADLDIRFVTLAYMGGERALLADGGEIAVNGPANAMANASPATPKRPSKPMPPFEGAFPESLSNVSLVLPKIQ
ncbi:MAG: hypothetical protein ACKVQT_25840 [Burkholderiales bacterium]